VPRSKQRTPQLRDRVLSAAVDLLAAEGVSGFTARSVAQASDTSTPAIYELFGDKGGLVRAVFFEGFRRLGAHLGQLRRSEDPRADLVQLVALYREFMREHQILSEVMFSRPFTDFAPGPAELQASGSVRRFILEQVHRCLQAGVLAGDPTDIAHALVALTQGLAAAENARRLGSTRASIDRRWRLAIDALIDGLSPSASGI
jgi:AcrR family transcriptional regulator